MSKQDWWFAGGILLFCLLGALGVVLAGYQPRAPAEPPPPVCRDGYAPVLLYPDKWSGQRQVCIPGYLP